MHVLRAPVTVVATLALLATSVCVAQEDTRPGTQVTPVEPLASCLQSCSGPECLRACVANEKVSLRGVNGQAQIASTSVLDCTRDALNNVSTCSHTFLTPPDSADYEGYWDCISVAGQVFLQCPAFQSTASAASDESLKLLGNATLGFMIGAAERDVRAARAGTLPLSARTLEHRGTKPFQEASTAADDQAPAPKTFAECASEFQKNRDTCIELFGGDQGGLADCNAVAKQVFQLFVGVKAA